MRLRTPDGVSWLLRAPLSGYGLIGRYVRLKGILVGTDKIDVNWIESAQAPSV